MDLSSFGQLKSWEATRETSTNYDSEKFNWLSKYIGNRYFTLKGIIEWVTKIIFKYFLNCVALNTAMIDI